MSQCTAHRSKGRGPCKAQAIAGGAVCRVHGGGAPQVKLAAKLRLAALVDPAIDVIMKALKPGKLRKGEERIAKETQIRTAFLLLDRTGHGPGQKLTLDGDVGIDLDSLRTSLSDKLARFAARVGERPPKPS